MWISVACVAMSLFTMLPVAWAISLALKSDSETIGGTFLPETPVWGNFKLAWDQYGMAQFFRNSIFVTFFSVLLTTVVGFIAAYAFTKLKFRGSESIYKVFLVVIIIPPAALVIPLLIELNTVHLYNSHIGLAIAYSAMGLPLSILIFRGFMTRFSSEIIEAARIDGCKESQIIRLVLMPLSKGPISTVLIVLFLANWNEFILSLVLIRDSEKYTLPVGLTSQIGQFRSQFNLISAASLIAAIPIFILYLFLQRNFQRGMSEGALRA
jgi:ABC-type glycerol-3-phosphate transport system permease component